MTEPKVPPGAAGEAVPVAQPAELKATSDIPPPASFEQYQQVHATPDLELEGKGGGTAIDRSKAAEAFADLVVSGRHRIAVITEYEGWELSETDKKPYVTIFGYLLKKYGWDPTLIGIIFAGVTIAIETGVTAFGYVKWRQETGRAAPKEPKK